jgi:hypothetical protein
MKAKFLIGCLISLLVLGTSQLFAGAEVEAFGEMDICRKAGSQSGVYEDNLSL